MGFAKHFVMFSIKCIELSCYCVIMVDSINFIVKKEANSRNAVTLITVKSLFA